MFNYVFTTAASLVELGGPVMAILLVLSVIAVAFILLKLVQFFHWRVGARKETNKALHLWTHGNREQAIQAMEASRSSVAAVLALAMRLGSDRSVPADVIEEEVSRVAQTRLYGLQRGFRGLDAIVQISPLLGLFGTVLGMIEAFQTLQPPAMRLTPPFLLVVSGWPF